MDLRCLLFVEPKGDTKLCTISLNSQDIDHFHNAIEELYYFEFFIGESPWRALFMMCVPVLTSSSSPHRPPPLYPSLVAQR